MCAVETSTDVGDVLCALLPAFEARFPGCFHDPARWGTADGTIPYPLFWTYWQAIPMIEARAQLRMAGAISLALSGDRAAWETCVQEAMGRGGDHG